MAYGWHAPAGPEPHGTLDAWQRHQRNGTAPCESCEIAREFAAWLQHRAALRATLRQLIGTLAAAYKADMVT